MKNRIAVLDYGIGNLASVAKALESIGADVNLVDSQFPLSHYSGLVLPGVGSFGACVKALRNVGFHDVIYEAVGRSLPTLGVCVGLQMLYEGSDESPNEAGLGIIEGRIELLKTNLRIPQMQWNRIAIQDRFSKSPLFSGLGQETWMYFVHSYGAPVGVDTSAISNYGHDFTAAIQKGNLFGTQFHPEKSSTDGLTMLANFVRISSI
ncbi:MULTISPECIES: imidazole glycerol phosphate synthase subunit HisH [Acidithrix]|uniref:Imidazole glycerol phosphate synthase subunit HisH n=1 Tax=Acidithrix ferrooxidans TaxID=1280514 RepID=A0A0D8HGY9_9ACTN|nr:MULTISPECIES: imidazole glycerol phosphate synthase subunit HisH [Acidithrix]KJF16326.1 imidazole glycerol phosphate synthase subunit HisH 1 [Acidithrix ferrooxidans]CAG4922773.1 unnamed protein product [Acidithrix sp. C25]